MNNLITTWQQGRFVDGPRYSRWSEEEKAKADRDERLRVRSEPTGNAICVCFDFESAAWIAQRLNLAAKLEQMTCDFAVVHEVLAEIERAMAKFPTWPTDPLHAFAVVGEEHGELQKELLQLTYEPHKSSLADARKEAVQLAAMALRFLMSFDRYEFNPGAQHLQNRE